MAIGDKVIVTCAVTGAVTTKRQCPAIPYTAVEIGEECRRAYEAGATVVHVHGRSDDGQPSYDPAVFAAYKREIEARSPVIINFSTGAVGLTKEQRINHILKTKPHIGALNMGSMNYAKYSAKRKDFVFSFVFANPFDEIIYYLKQMNETGVRPECECFDTSLGMARPTAKTFDTPTSTGRPRRIWGYSDLAAFKRQHSMARHIASTSRRDIS